MPEKPDELKHSWLRSLHRDDIDELKVVYVCSKHFREGEVETTHKVPNGDGSYREILLSRPKLKDRAVATIYQDVQLTIHLTLPPNEPVSL